MCIWVLMLGLSLFFHFLLTLLYLKKKNQARQFSIIQKPSLPRLIKPGVWQKNSDCSNFAIMDKLLDTYQQRGYSPKSQEREKMEIETSQYFKN